MMRRMVRRLVPLLALIAACGPDGPRSSTVAQEIVGGSADAGSVVSDVFLIAMTFNNGTSTLCSATLVGPRSLVTAAHCVDPARQTAATSVTIKAVFKPTDVGLMSSDLLAVTDVRMHPMWTASATSATYDIAMLLLASPSGISPRPINRAPLTGFVGQPVKLVGYGRTDPSNANSSGTRRLANATVTAVDANSFDFGVAGTLGICSGDSGGPSLHTFPDAVERIVGVHSLTTSASCGSGTDSRIDFHLAFIDQWLLEKEGTGGVDSGVPDAGKPDAGKPDSGEPGVDVGKPDSGVVAMDSGMATMDAGRIDAGVPDAGIVDGGTGGAVGGCGCSSAPVPWLWVGLLGLLRKRRLRA